MIVERRTPAAKVTFEGLGLHTGTPVRLSVSPGESGIWFRLGSEKIEARPENVTDVRRSTKLGSIGTVEHLMSAFGGLQITDAEVELTASECPAMDGSSRPFVAALLGVGFEELTARELPGLFTRIFRQEEGSKIAVSKGTGHWRYEYASPGRWPERQEFEVENASESYVDEIAGARTFAHHNEVPKLQELGFGQGLTHESVLVLGCNEYDNEPRFPDEPARHKLLDVVGDLYLAGVPIRHLNVSAERTGHRSNVEAAKLLAMAVMR